MIQDTATSSRYRSNARRATIDKLTCSTSARCSARCRISSGTRNDTRGQWSRPRQRQPAAPRRGERLGVSLSAPPAVQSEHHLGEDVRELGRVHIDITTVDSLGCGPVPGSPRG